MTRASAPIQSDKEKARKARKRLTDRKSQQHHRERQRAYVQQLEETIETYKRSCEEGGDPDIKKLIEENDRLRARCRNLESLLARIRNLSSSVELPPAEAAPGPISTEAPITRLTFSQFDQGTARDASENNIAEMDQDAALLDLALGSPMIDLDGMSDFQGDVDQLASLDVLEQAGPAEDTSPLSTSSQPQLQPDTPGNLIEMGLETTPDEQSATDGNGLSGIDLDLCLTNFMETGGMSLDLVPRSLTTQEMMLSRVMPISPPSSTAETMYAAFPVTSVTLSWDKILQRMINEARDQHARGLFPTAKPTLRSVLAHRSSDVLAARLYHFLCMSGAMPLHHFLATFWVQYLFLRWHVLGTLAAFLQMPQFMRPTDLEAKIPHPLCIGMLVWPDVRRILIRDSLTLDPETVGASLLRALDPNWHPSAFIQGELIGSTDVLAVIEQQACVMDSWKVSEDFRRANPQLSQCKLPRRQ